MAAPGANCDTCPQVPQCALTLSQPGYTLFQTHIKIIYSNVRYVQEYIQVCIKVKPQSLST